MRRKKKTVKPVSAKSAEKAMKAHNFWIAFEMLCNKIGRTKEFFWYAKGRDADATAEQKKSFIRKITRLLAFNYDVHRCPMPSTFGTLKKDGDPGSLPLRYPPEWTKKDV